MKAALPIPVFRVPSLESVHDFFGVGYNPFAKSLDRSEVLCEWKQAVQILSEQLQQHWSIGTHSEDAYVETITGTDRIICVELSNLTILNASLPTIAYNAVVTLPWDYCVDFCDARGYLNKVTGGPSFNLLVTKSEFWVYSESETVISALGFEGVIQDPGTRTLVDLRL